MSSGKRAHGSMCPAKSRARYQRRFSWLYRVAYLLSIGLFVVIVSVNPLAKALPGDYTWARAGVTGISGDRANWSTIAMSADGTKLAAATAYDGSIYTSADSGTTWEQTNVGSHQWQSIASSADGTKLVAAEADAYIYTSTDSGTTWVKRTSAGERYWLSVVSSADGTKLTAAESNGFIYTSADSGATWTEQTAAGSHQWQSIASSADGTKLVAAELAYYDDTILSFVGSVYTSADSGATWTEQTTAGIRSWISVASSSDGMKLAATEMHYDDASQTFIGSVYTSADSGATWTERTAAGEHRWNAVAVSSANSDIFATTYEGATYMSGDFGATWTEQITNGPTNSTVSSADGVKLAAIGMGSVYTSADSGDSWTERTIVGARAWTALASSADGTKLVAAAGSYGDNAYIYTSTDSGASWTERTAAGSRHWSQVASSADGVKLAAIDNNYIYTSADSGASWTERTAAGSRYWQSIASSADGTKLAAVNSDGSIYTSVDSGATWTERLSNVALPWQSIASSADGTKLAAVEVHYDDTTGTNSGSIYTSIDSGVTWVERGAAGLRQWKSITSSADGTKLAATEAHYDETTGEIIGSIFTSADSGDAWTQQTTISENQYQPIVSSADGKELATLSNDSIYTSSDFGVTWTERTIAGMRGWRAITLSANGTRLATAIIGGSLYLGSIEGPATHTFDYGTLSAPSGVNAATSQSQLSITSSACYTFNIPLMQLLDSSGLRVPEQGVTLLGGIAYNVSCAIQGGSTQATVTLGSYYQDISKLRIYKKVSSSNVLEDITQQVAVTNTADPSNTHVTTLSYTLVDGGNYDEDGVANGTIVDPVYFGIIGSATTGGETGTLANTGTNQWGMTGAAILLVGLSFMIYRREINIKKGTM